MGNGNILVTLGPLVLLLVIMYFLLIRPQKKREKSVNQMRSNIKVGDEIITIGGICGKVVKTKDDSIVIQVGADKVKFEMMRWSVSKVVDSASKPAANKVKPEPVEEPEETEEAPKKELPKRLKKAAPAETEEEEIVEEVSEVADVKEK